MVDICAWRARIGHFHLTRVAAALRRGKLQAGDGEVDVTLTDILVFFVVLLTFVRLCFCFYYNLLAAGTCPFMQTWERQVMKQTISSWEGTSYDEYNVTDMKLAIQVPVVASMCVGNMAWSFRKILLSNDVERNPGPEHGDPAEATATGDVTKGEAKGGETGSVAAADILLAIEKQGLLFQAQNEQLQKQLKEHSKEQAQQAECIRKELGEIKRDVKAVSDKCEEINLRCNKLERDNSELSVKMAGVENEMKDIYSKFDERKEESTRLLGVVGVMREEMIRMSGEMDRLEEFSRRDNLRMFGVPSVSSKEREDYDDCCYAVCNVLNSVDRSGREWTDKDIVRAHRVGQARSGEPKPMIVKFTQWRDKMRLITDRDFRAKLERDGVRVANDLTRRQMDLVAEARREGKAAFFVKGKMTIGPKRDDHRAGYTRGTTSVGVVDSDTAPSSLLFPAHHPSPSPAHPFNQSQSPLAGAVGGVSTRSGIPLAVSDGRGQRAESTGESSSRVTRQQQQTAALGSGVSRQAAGARSQLNAPSTAGCKQQQGLESYLRGQHGSRTKSTPAGGAADSRTLRSSVTANK
jgi:hypothetical protein